MAFKVRFLLLVFFAMLAGVWPTAAQAAGGLGAATGFAVLAGTALTCTNSNVTGPAGVASSNTAVTSTGCVMQVQVDAGAYADFLNAYSGIAANLGPCTQTFLASDTLAGLTLGPGTYCFAAAATLTGTLTLAGTGPWFFEIGTGGTGALTATSFTVVGGNPCNAFWWVRQDTTLTTSAFQGTILAGSVTLTDTSLAGRAWAKVAVTMTRSPIVGCTAAVPVPPCLAARQALDEAKAQDVIEDASERAKTGEKDANKDEEGAKDSGNGDEDKAKDPADKAEDKAEAAAMKRLEDAVEAACEPQEPGEHHCNGGMSDTSEDCDRENSREGGKEKSDEHGAVSGSAAAEGGNSNARVETTAAKSDPSNSGNVETKAKSNPDSGGSVQPTGSGGGEAKAKSKSHDESNSHGKSNHDSSGKDNSESKDNNESN